MLRTQAPSRKSLGVIEVFKHLCLD